MLNEETSAELATDSVEIEVVSLWLHFAIEKQYNLCNLCQMEVSFCEWKVHFLCSNREMPSLECLILAVPGFLGGYLSIASSIHYFFFVWFHVL